jgi:hypothetical protein
MERTWLFPFGTEAYPEWIEYHAEIAGIGSFYFLFGGKLEW